MKKTKTKILTEKDKNENFDSSCSDFTGGNLLLCQASGD